MVFHNDLEIISPITQKLEKKIIISHSMKHVTVITCCRSIDIRQFNIEYMYHIYPIQGMRPWFLEEDASNFPVTRLLIMLIINGTTSTYPKI